MTKENKFKIGLCLQGIALSMDDITLKANEDRLKMIEDIIAGEQEPCSDAISRQAVLDGIEELKKSPWFNDDTHEAKIIRKEAVEIVKDLCVKDLPSVNPQEPKTGHWEFVGYDCYRCTECGEVYTSNQFDAINNYYDNRFPKGCPNCGAKMESEVTE